MLHLPLYILCFIKNDENPPLSERTGGRSYLIKKAENLSQIVKLSTSSVVMEIEENIQLIIKRLATPKKTLKFHFSFSNKLSNI